MECRPGEAEQDPGKAGHRKIEAAPKKMDGTDFSDEPRPKPMEDKADRNQSFEEARHGRGIIGSSLPVVPKRDRIGNFVRSTVELRRAAKPFDQFAEPGVKFGDGHRPERDFGPASIRRLPDDCVIDEIEDDLNACPVRNQGRRQATCVDVEGRVPRMVDPRRPCEPVFADDLAI